MTALFAALTLAARADGDALSCNLDAETACPPGYSCEQDVCVAVGEPSTCKESAQCLEGETCLADEVWEGVCAATGDATTPPQDELAPRCGLIWVQHCTGMFCGWYLEYHCWDSGPTCTPRYCVT